MRLTTTPLEPPEINLAPLLDVVFLIVIFFVVTSTLQQQQALNVELPEVDQGSSMAEGAIVITIHADGDIHIAGAEDGSGLDALASALERQRAANLTARVLIRADSMARHARVAEVLAAARGLGVTQVGIATLQEAP